jgi:hypothetical protein
VNLLLFPGFELLESMVSGVPPEADQVSAPPLAKKTVGLIEKKLHRSIVVF